MKLFLTATILAGVLLSQASDLAQPEVAPIPALSPEESMKTFEVPEGFRLELVASEPMVQEPVSFAFDGEGALYVCEWLTYMLDEHATGQMDPISRVVKLVDTDGDGKMDQRTVFIDEVLLPRTVLPMEDHVLVNLTGSNSIWAYYDENSDGVSDRRELVYEGDPNTGNIEHQASGMVWNLDNVIDTNYHRLRYNKDGKLEATPHSMARISQWGLTRDDSGRLYCTWAGGKNPAHSFQFPAGYPIVEMQEHAEGYEIPYSICTTEDQSSGNYDYENERVLTEFSAASGQGFIRSDLMRSLEGLLVTPEPVGRLIRGTRFENENGKRVAYNATPGRELICSSDTYFRPTWSGMGPDGALYFADMYRGIIQEKDWFPTEGDHPWVLRYHRVRDWDMIKVVGRGRIYRLVSEEVELHEKPDLYSKLSEELVAYLDHGSGWWRDEAHKLIVRRGDPSAVPALEAMVDKAPSDRARINAMWALRGLEALDPDYIFESLNSDSEEVRLAGIRLSEAFLKVGGKKMIAAVQTFADRELSDDEVIQLINSLNRSQPPGHEALVASLKSRNSNNAILLAIEKRAAEKVAVAAMGESAKRGAVIYESICMTCHGKDGRGVVAENQLLAPGLIDSRLFQNSGRFQPLVSRVLLDGMMGPLRGKTYGEGVMVPFKSVYTDEQIADVMNYIGNRWHKRDWKTSTRPEDVAKARAQSSGRNLMWTEEELVEEAKKLGLPSPY